MILRILISTYLVIGLFCTGINALPTFAATNGAEINGRVVDFFGSAWSDATLELRSTEISSPPQGRIMRTTRTNSDGEYRFTDLPESSYEITILAGPGIVKQTKTTPILQSGTTTIMDFGIEVGLTFCVQKQVYGFVKSHDGKPLEDSTVVLANVFKQGYQRMVKAGKNGTYSAEVCLGGQYLIYAMEPGFEIQSKTVIIPGDSSRASTERVDFHLSQLRLDVKR